MSWLLIILLVFAFLIFAGACVAVIAFAVQNNLPNSSATSILDVNFQGSSSSSATAAVNRSQANATRKNAGGSKPLAAQGRRRDQACANSVCGRRARRVAHDAL
jgi:flagellar basal body-associated protein FliL